VKPILEVLPDHAQASAACALRIVAAARAALGERGRFTLALTGGSTPHDAYRILAAEHREDVDWKRVDFFVGDERMVPLDDPRSNFGTARRLWLDALALPGERLHPMPVGANDDAAARACERELRACAPQGLDCVLLGLGDDGHTASLFPGQIAHLPASRWVIAARAPASSPVERRLSLTFNALAAARELVFLVTGASKAGVVARVLAGDCRLPAAQVRSRGEVRWILDAAAASSRPAS